MFSMDRTTFGQMVKSHPDFPKPVVLGKTPRGRPILRYRKYEVLAYLTRGTDAAN
jgi:predicted DNA-binding transcriptional regulator AlpA